MPGTASQSVAFSPDEEVDGITYRVNIPSSTADTKSGSIFFQIEAPTDFEWVALGQGTRMTGANIFVLYSSSDSNVTLSPRVGKGHVEPEFNRDTKVSLLDGTGISNGKMVANVRCDNCLSWEGGSMRPRDRASQWIWAAKKGAPLQSSDVSEGISFHDFKGTFNINLRKAIGGSSPNPFVGQDQDDSTTTGATSSSSASGKLLIKKRAAHGIMMSLAFVVLFPSFALTLHVVPYAKTVPHIHAPLQIATLCLAVAGFGVGVSVARDTEKTSSYHAIIGYIVIACLLLFQPALGYFQHLHFRKTGEKGVQGIAHRWIGRLGIMLAIINGGLGFRMSGVGNPGVPKAGAITYIVIAIAMGILYVTIVIFMSSKKKRATSSEQSEEDGEKAR